jgi:hypothetical protein
MLPTADAAAAAAATAATATTAGNKLVSTIIPEPINQLIKNLCGVKDMGLVDLEES